MQRPMWSQAWNLAQNLYVTLQVHRWVSFLGQQKPTLANTAATWSLPHPLPLQDTSGSSLVCQVNKTWIQMGVVSWNFGCGRRGFPSIYTSTSHFTKWVKRQIVDMRFASMAVPSFLSPFILTSYILLVSLGSLWLLWAVFLQQSFPEATSPSSLLCPQKWTPEAEQDFRTEGLWGRVLHPLWVLSPGCSMKLLWTFWAISSYNIVDFDQSPLECSHHKTWLFLKLSLLCWFYSMSVIMCCVILGGCSLVPLVVSF